jgi:hypothetical protein
MHQLSVGCVFRNESHIMAEWLKHYLHHGASHFYLINDNSTDDYLPILQPFIDSGRVSLFNAQFHYYLGRQKDMYNTFILPHVNDRSTEWLLMVDMDEFLWSPRSVKVTDILQGCTHLGQIQMTDLLFGSNGFVEQPLSAVASFTKRQREPRGHLKYFVNSAFAFSSLNVHHATFQDVGRYENGQYFQRFDNSTFVVNHYCCQSRNFWDSVKCTRGDADHYLQRKPEDFDALDVNEVEDLGLKEQNAPLEKI